MRKLMIAILGLGLFSMAIPQANAESVIGTGTISIQQMKDTIVKLIQDDTAQSQRIAYLESQLANLETQVAKLAGQTQEIAAKVASTYTSTPHSSDVNHGRPYQKFGFKVSRGILVEHCGKYCLISHLKKENSYCVKTDLNVRRGPGVKYRVIDVLRKGTVVKAVAREGEWIKISHPSYRGRLVERGKLVGWVYSSYLKECSHGRNEK